MDKEAAVDQAGPLENLFVLGLARFLVLGEWVLQVSILVDIQDLLGNVLCRPRSASQLIERQRK